LDGVDKVTTGAELVSPPPWKISACTNAAIPINTIIAINIPFI